MYAILRVFGRKDLTPPPEENFAALKIGLAHYVNRVGYLSLVLIEVKVNLSSQ